MRGSGTQVVLGRLGAGRPVLGAAALTTVIAAAVAATLATVASQVLSQAAQRQLTAAPGTTIMLNAAAPASVLPPASAIVRDAIRTGLGGSPFTLRSATWSAQLPWPAGTRSRPAGAGRAASGRPVAAQAGRGGQAVLDRTVPGSVLPGRTVPEAEAAVLPGLRSQAVLVAGRWPGGPLASGVIPAALPATAAARLHLAVGGTLTLRDLHSGRLVRFQVTGLFRARDPAAPYWRLDLIGPGGASTTGRYTTYGPFVVSPAGFSHGLTAGDETWVATPDLARIPEAALSADANRLSAQLGALQDPGGRLGGVQVTTRLPAVLHGAADDLVVARSLLAIGALQVLLLAGAALAAAARLLASQREGEVALLAARGGGRWQLARISLAEAVPVALAAAAVGALASGLLAGLIIRSGPLRAAGLRLPGVPGGAWQAGAVVAGLACAVMLAPVLRPVLPGLARARRGRLPAVSRVVAAGADAALIVLAVLAVWQLRHYSVVAPSAGGGLGVDPVLVLAPAVALAGGTMAGVRLLPAVARAGDRLAARTRGLTAALALWRISRRPLRQAGPALLVVLGVATGTLALCQHQSWVRSAADQAAFSAGAPVRVAAQQPLSLSQAGSLAAGRPASMPVASVTQGSGADVVVVDAAKAAGIVLLRRDLSAAPPRMLFRRITPRATPGLALAGRPAQLLLTARLGPAALHLGPAPVTVAVQDADGDTYSAPAGVLPADGRPHQLAIALPRPAVYPVRLLQISVAYTMPATKTAGDAVFAVGGATTGIPASPGTAAVPGLALARWPVTASSPGLAALSDTYAAPTAAAAPGDAAWLPAAGAAGTVSFSPGYGQDVSPDGSGRFTGLLTLAAPGLKDTVIPGIASRGFLAASQVTVGSTVQLAFGGPPVLVRIVATVAAFPTVTGPGGAVVVDLAALQDALVSHGQPAVPVTQWWLDAADPPAARPPGAAVTTRAGLAQALLGNPVSAAPQQALLAIAVTGAVLALAGFAVSVTTTVAERRLESALLSALGLSRSAQVRQLCLEELMLSGPAALAGVALGAGMALLLVPAVTRTAVAASPVPPALTQLAWAQVIPLAALVAALPVLAAALTVARRPDPAAQLRTGGSG